MQRQRWRGSRTRGPSCACSGWRATRACSRSARTARWASGRGSCVPFFLPPLGLVHSTDVVVRRVGEGSMALVTDPECGGGQGGRTTASGTGRADDERRADRGGAAGRGGEALAVVQGCAHPLDFGRAGIDTDVCGEGSWREQRAIHRQKVTAVRFIRGGEALLGGTGDGVV